MSKEHTPAQFIYSLEEKSVTAINSQALILAANHGVNLMDNQRPPLTRGEAAALILAARLNGKPTARTFSHSVTLDGRASNGSIAPRLHIIPHFTYDENGKRTGIAAAVSEEQVEHNAASKIQEKDAFFALFPSLVASAVRDRKPMGFLIISHSKHTTGMLALPDAYGAGVQKNMAACIEKELRSSDVAVRLGNEECGILLTNVERADETDGLTAAVHRYAASLRDDCPSATICMGAARLDLSSSDKTKTGNQSEQFFMQADVAWTHACNAARNSHENLFIALYDPGAPYHVKDISLDQ